MAFGATISDAGLITTNLNGRVGFRALLGFTNLCSAKIADFYHFLELKPYDIEHCLQEGASA